MSNLITDDEIVNALPSLSQIPISEVEKALMQEPQVPCPVIHRFGPGVYIREVTLPQGSLVVGHHQNFEHLNVFLKGRVTMLNDDGSTTELKAPMIFTGKPGRKIGFIHETVVWMNIYATAETDVEQLEARLITKSTDWLESISNRLSSFHSDLDRNDFNQMLTELGLSAEQMKAQSEYGLDQCNLPYGDFKIKVGSSTIDGKGLFATADIEPGEIIAPARINGLRTIAGRFTNHSVEPNAVMIEGSRGEILLQAIKPILGCHGGLDGQEITINYRDSYKLTQEIGRRE